MADIELVIKIPAEQYETLNAKFQSEVKAIINTPGLIKAIKNGKPLDEVLDEIRAEIEEYEADCNYQLSEEDNCRTCNKVTFGSIYRIIDKRKKERSDTCG